MGEGALAGMPLQLAGTRKILEFMDWGDYGAKGTFINIGSIGMHLKTKNICICMTSSCLSPRYVAVSHHIHHVIIILVFHILHQWFIISLFLAFK